MKVMTVKGPLEAGELRIEDVVQWGDNSRTIVTKWYLGDEIVKQDAHIALLMPLASNVTGGSV